MRTVTLALLTGFTLAGLANAQAADLDYGVLRGQDYEPEAPAIDWNGVYFGGHGGYTSAALGFTNVFQPQVATILKKTTAESELNASSLLTPHSARTGGTSFGGFAGFNYQFDETVVGIEADYTRFDHSGSTSDAVARFKTIGSGYLETVALDGIASTRIEDYGTIRVRAGYAVGSFLPFLTGGLAIGRAQVFDKVNVQDYGYDQTTYQANVTAAPGQKVYVNNFGYSSFDQANPSGGTPSKAQTSVRSSTKVVGGVALGGGLEFALTQNIILRGEYQYVLFNDFDGHKANLNTVRGGAAVKF